MRLTIKVNNEYITDDTKCMKNKYINKLGQLEDIEELCEKIVSQPIYEKLFIPNDIESIRTDSYTYGKRIKLHIN